MVITDLIRDKESINVSDIRIFLQKGNLLFLILLPFICSFTFQKWK